MYIYILQTHSMFAIYHIIFFSFCRLINIPYNFFFILQTHSMLARPDPNGPHYPSETLTCQSQQGSVIFFYLQKKNYLTLTALTILQRLSPVKASRARWEFFFQKRNNRSILSIYIYTKKKIWQASGASKFQPIEPASAFKLEEERQEGLTKKETETP